MYYGLNHVWQQGDAVSRAIVVVLAIMSVLSWTMIIYKSVQLIRLKRQGGGVERRFWLSGKIEGDCISMASSSNNPFLNLVAVAREVQDTHTDDSSLENSMSPDEWLERCLRVAFDDSLARLQSGLALLASIGSTAPFVGLFGTVWGIYHALLAISVSGQSSLEEVAGPVGESLVMTAFGLVVAIPAVLGYNAIARGNKAVSHKLMRFTHDLQAYFMKGQRYRPSRGWTGSQDESQELELRSVAVANPRV